MEQFREGLVFKAHRLLVSLNFRLEISKEEGEATVRLAMSMILKTLFPESVTTSRSPSASALIPATREELSVDSLQQKKIWSLAQY